MQIHQSAGDRDLSVGIKLAQDINFTVRQSKQVVISYHISNNSERHQSQHNQITAPNSS